MEHIIPRTADFVTAISDRYHIYCTMIFSGRIFKFAAYYVSMWDVRVKYWTEAALGTWHRVAH